MSKAKRIVRCPECAFDFDITYGRTFACAGCPSSVQCTMAKCPKCGNEFPLESKSGSTHLNLYRKYAQNFE